MTINYVISNMNGGYYDHRYKRFRGYLMATQYDSEQSAIDTLRIVLNRRINDNLHCTILPVYTK